MKIRESKQAALSLACLAAFVIVTGCGGEGGPLSPEEALETFTIVEGFRLEQFAAEPLVIDPVEIAFDENGGVYVAELADNPEDPPPGQLPESRIAYLEDEDGDGKIDRRTVFAEHLLSVEGVQPWKGGVIVTAAPDVLYLRDEDGDRKADVKEVLYTGFDVIDNIEGRVSNPRLGIDNWIYMANTARAGEITSPAHPEMAPLQVRGWDVRFDPLSGKMELASGPAQFGLTFDSWGRQFISQNTIHLRHVPIPADYLARNPYLVATDTAAEISADGRPAPIYPTSKPQQWRIERTEARQERYANTQPGRIEQLEGYFTAAAGSTVYVGDAFPERFVNAVFTGDGNGNLVHRDLLEPDGATFSAHSWPTGADFLTSTDNWFRPVNLANAPDGNLYVVDYYREYLEDPQFIPDAIKQRLEMNFRSGDDRGRIYRIVPEEPRNQASLKPILGQAAPDELLALLAHENGWYRRTAQRLLLERQDRSVAPALEQTAREHENPLARLHALWTLEGLSALNVALVEKALGDPEPKLRVHALRLAEPFLPKLSDAIIALADDATPHVQFQAALTLGNLPKDARALDALARLGAQYADDEWFRLALLSAPADSALPLLSRLAKQPELLVSDAEGGGELIAGLSRTLGARRDTRELTAWIGSLSRLREAQWQSASLGGLAAGLELEGRKRLRSPAAAERLTVLLNSDDEAALAAAIDAAQYFEMPAWIAEAKRQALDESLPVERRALMVRALRGGDFATVAPVLEKIVSTPSPQALKAAAVAALEAFDDEKAGQILLAGWDGYDAGTRAAATEALLRRRERVNLLLDAVENGQIASASLDDVLRIRLSQFPDAGIQQRAAKLVPVEQSDRAAVVAEYQDVLELDGSSAAGREVFERECAKCHLRSGERGRIGPDLSGVNNEDRESLLTAILDPSAGIESRYTNYLVETDDGRLYDGLVASETSTTVTLRGELEDVTLLRESIVDMRASRVSLMPEGLEDSMSRQEIADVIAYLRAGL